MSWRTNPYAFVQVQDVPRIPEVQFPPQIPATADLTGLRQARQGERVWPIANCPGCGIDENGDFVKLAPDPPPTAEELEEHRLILAHLAKSRGEHPAPADEPLSEATGYRDNPRRSPSRRPWWKFWAA